ncbi:MAG TPA: 4-hydroxy-tetrahydrodipicolinate reductase [Burkholderiaceae bacterium]|nr:4-hydroxy-tetrahydrodipicolinate reductase [Burkholderiaceae bacterium]
MTRRVVLAGATGWAGSALARALVRQSDLQLVAAVAQRAAGKPLGAALQIESDCPVFARADEALAIGCDVFVEFTKPMSAKRNVLAALAAGAHVVIGTSGLTDDDLAGIDRAARERKRGVLACGNFAITAVLAMKFSEVAARYLDHFEVIDYGSATKIDVPSGTARELAARLARVRAPKLDVPLEKHIGPRETRGASLSGVQVHSIRQPGFVLGIETVFGADGERLSIKHEAGASAEPYVGGALLAIRNVDSVIGVRRGLDSVMEGF